MLKTFIYLLFIKATSHWTFYSSRCCWRMHAVLADHYSYRVCVNLCVLPFLCNALSLRSFHTILPSRSWTASVSNVTWHNVNNYYNYNQTQSINLTLLHKQIKIPVGTLRSGSPHIGILTKRHTTSTWRAIWRHSCYISRLAVCEECLRKASPTPRLCISITQYLRH